MATKLKYVYKLIVGFFKTAAAIFGVEAKLDSLKRSEIQYNTKIRLARQDLVNVAARANTYLGRAEGLLRYGNERIDKVKVSLRTMTRISLASQTLFPRVGGRGRKCGGGKGSGVSGP